MAKSASGRTEITEEGDRIAISTPYNQEFVGKIKKITGRRWDAQRRVWTVPRASEYRVRKLVKESFPAENPDAWKETAADEIRGNVLALLPDGSSVCSEVIEEDDGSTTVSISNPDAAERVEANVTIEDESQLRETISSDVAEHIAKKLQEKKSCWVLWD